MEQLTDDILDDFQRLTSYDVRAFLQSYLDFSDSHYSNITNFYTGVVDVLPATSMASLNSLVIGSNKLVDVVMLNAQSLEEYRFWILTEYLDEIAHSLETTLRLSRWARSFKTNTGYKKQVASEYMLKQGETLQEVNQKTLASNDPDGWVDVALQNDLAEDDYTLAGGALIHAIFQNNNSFVLNSVVDNVDSQEKVYGIDVQAEIAFDLVTEDLVQLTPKKTLMQTIDILSNLNKGDDPAFLQRGLNIKGTVLGGNVAGISYPVIFRDLAANFATDDSFKAISVTDVRRAQDKVYLDFTVQPKSGSPVPSSTTV